MTNYVSPQLSGAADEECETRAMGSCWSNGFEVLTGGVFFDELS